MDIRVSGHKVETGEALREHVTNKLQSVDEHYNIGMVRGDVTFNHGPHDRGFACTVRLHYRGGDFVAEGSSPKGTAQLAFGIAAKKIEKQARRLHRARKDVPHQIIEFVDDLNAGRAVKANHT